MAAPDFQALAELLGPALTPETFLAEHYDKRPFITRRRGATESGALFGGLLTLEDVDELLVRALLPGSAAEVRGCRTNARP